MIREIASFVKHISVLFFIIQYISRASKRNFYHTNIKVMGCSRGANTFNNGARVGV